MGEAAEQLPHRGVERAPENVPQRHVDGADRGDGEAASPEGGKQASARQCKMRPRAVIHELPQARGVAGVLADQRRPDVVIDQRDQRRIIAAAEHRGAAFAMADQAGFGLDPHQRRVERGDYAEIAGVLLVLGDRYVNPSRVN